MENSDQPPTQATLNYTKLPQMNQALTEKIPSFSYLLKQAIQILKLNWKPIAALFGISVIIYVVLFFVFIPITLVILGMGITTALIPIIYLLLFIPFFVILSVVSFSFILLIKDIINNQTASAINSLKQAFSNLKLVIITTLCFILTIIGSSFIPFLSIIISMGLIFTFYVAIEENISGFYALTRSWQLTKGYRKKIFIYTIYYFLLSFVVLFISNISMITIILIPLAVIVNISTSFVWLIFTYLLYQKIYKLKKTEVVDKKVNPLFLICSGLTIILIILFAFILPKVINALPKTSFNNINNSLITNKINNTNIDSKTYTDNIFPTIPISPTISSYENHPDIIRYSIDSDGDAIPDFLEKELGYNPNIHTNEECEQEACEDLNISKYEYENTNVLIILDASGSMAQISGQTTKMDAAKDAINRFIDGLEVENNFNIALMVYGHKGSNSVSDKAYSCSEIEILYPLGTLNKSQFKNSVAGFNAKGWTPIEGALNLAPSVFKGKEGENNHIILISDGIEQCDGNPVTAAKSIKDSDLKLTVNIIGFNITSSDQQKLKEISQASGGIFTNVTNNNEIYESLQVNLNNYRERINFILCNKWSDINFSQCFKDRYIKAHYWLVPGRSGKLTSKYDELSRMEIKKIGQTKINMVEEYEKLGDVLAEKVKKHSNEAQELLKQ